MTRLPTDPTTRCVDPVTGRLQDPGAVGDGFAVAWDINARGDVVGYAQTSEHTTRAVMWQPSSQELAGEDELACCNCTCWESEPSVLEPFNTDVGYQAGVVGILAGPGSAPSTFSPVGNPSRAGGGYMGGGGGGYGGFGGGGGGGTSISSSSGGGGSGGGGSSASGGDGEVPEPATVIIWVAGLLAFIRSSIQDAAGNARLELHLEAQAVGGDRIECRAIVLVVRGLVSGCVGNFLPCVACAIEQLPRSGDPTCSAGGLVIEPVDFRTPQLRGLLPIVLHPLGGHAVVPPGHARQ